MEYLIHVKQAWDNNVWKNLLEFVKKHKCRLFLMPPQLDCQKAVLGYNGDDKKLSSILSERYLELLNLKEKYNFKIGAHIHFSLKPQDLTNETKDEIFESGYNWLCNIFGNLDSIAFDWFKYDDYLKEKCIEKNLKIIHYKLNAITLHDYDLPLSNKDKIYRWAKDVGRIIKSRL